VFLGIELFQQSQSASISGTLTLNLAAHSSFGSSAMFFKHIAAVLLKIFDLPTTEPLDRDLRALFPQRYD
jgi:hypothetical protein